MDENVSVRISVVLSLVDFMCRTHSNRRVQLLPAVSLVNSNQTHPLPYFTVTVVLLYIHVAFLLSSMYPVIL